MNDGEKKLSSSEQKNKIRERYKGINLEEIDIIPALPPEKLLESTSRKRVAVYARVSTDDPRQTSSYELQRNHYMDYVSRQPNWILTEIYADEGISGTSLKHRDAFIKMIADCKAGKIDLIITKTVARFARNIVDCISYQRELKQLTPPVGIYFETEGIYTLNENSEMSLSFIATLAQEESHSKSEIMNASIEMRFKRGIFLTPTLLGYDHDEDGNLIINEEEARIVRLIFYMYIYGFSCTKIAETLTSLKVRTKKDNCRWSAGAVLQILQNERHCGDVLARKTFTPNYLDHKSKKNRQDRNQYRQKEHHDAIISRADFIAVQHMISNAKYGNKEILPSLHVITEGIFTGFVPIHPRWAGFTPADYIEASRQALHAPKSTFSEISANEGDFDFRGFEIARGQYFETSNKIIVTFTNDSIAFGLVGIRKLNAPLYIDMLIHPEEKLLAVRPGKRECKYSYQWAKRHNGDIASRTIAASSFAPMLYKLLEWNLENKYKVLGYKKEKDDEMFLIFDLRDAQILIPNQDTPERGYATLKPLTTPGNKRILAYPEEWAEGFGTDYYEAKQKDEFNEAEAWESRSPGTPVKPNTTVTTTREAGQLLNKIISEIKGEQDGENRTE